jgi:hypothetical protein
MECKAAGSQKEPARKMANTSDQFA